MDEPGMIDCFILRATPKTAVWRPSLCCFASRRIYGGVTSDMSHRPGELEQPLCSGARLLDSREWTQEGLRKE